MVIQFRVVIRRNQVKYFGINSSVALGVKQQFFLNLALPYRYNRKVLPTRYILLSFSHYPLLVHLKALQICGHLSFFNLLNILTFLQLGARIAIQGGVRRFIITLSYNIILTSFTNSGRPRVGIRTTKQPCYRSIGYSFLKLFLQQHIIGYFTTYRHFISSRCILGRQQVISLAVQAF